MNRFIYRKTAFTLVEIMTVVTLVGLLASLAIPAFQSVSHKARNAALINDIRTFEGAFLVYNLETGTWPEDRMPGIFPPEMEGYLSRDSFTGTTPLGGSYDWDPSSSGSRPSDALATISVRNHVANDAQINALLTTYDDGNPQTGRIRVNGSVIHFVIELQ